MERPRDDGLRFARFIYLPRVSGLALVAVCIGGALWQQDAHPALWAALLVYTLVWPHLAYPLARASRNPYRAELRNLVLDSAAGGAWVAAIGFNLAPSAVLLSMLAMDKMSIGGWRFLARCLTAQVAAAAAVIALTGLELRLESDMTEVLASLPLLVVYPSAVGLLAYRLSRQVRRQNQTLAALSSTDGLSGLLNRTHWEQALAAEFRRLRRSGRAGALLMIDIDHFKNINDTHGHPAGDEVIRRVAELLRASLRQYDVPGRYGGEEFGVVLPGTDAAGARVVAERIRARIESAALAPQYGVRGTVSIGIALAAPRDPDHRAWIARADQALYRAKAAGRNRTELFDTQ